MTRSLVTCLWCVAVLISACGKDAPDTTRAGQPGDMCTSTKLCVSGFACESGVCSMTEPRRITLSWDADTDLDLHVQTPNGEHVYFDRAEGSQAWLGTDGCAADSCARADGTNDDTHYEHAFLRDIPFPTASDAGDLDAAVDDEDAGSDENRGTSRDLRYDYWVENYDCDVGGSFTLQVIARDGTVEATEAGTLAAGCTTSERFVLIRRPPTP